MNIHESLIVSHPSLKIYNIWYLSQSGETELITVLCFQPLPLLLRGSFFWSDLWLGSHCESLRIKTFGVLTIVCSIQVPFWNKCFISDTEWVRIFPHLQVSLPSNTSLTVYAAFIPPLQARLWLPKLKATFVHIISYLHGASRVTQQPKCNLLANNAKTIECSG